MFQSFGKKLKFIKHLNRRDEGRVKDYFLSFLEGQPYPSWKDHPHADVLEDAIFFLRGRGWKCCPDKDEENKFYLISPNGEYYSNSVRKK